MVSLTNSSTASEASAKNGHSRLVDSPIGILSASCRLPGGVTDMAELWQMLKIGRNCSSIIPVNRIATRDILIRGEKYGNMVEAGNFIDQDVSGFDASFFNISRSEAELLDPQQRILLECVQECMENAGLKDLSDTGVFVGLMEKEYDVMQTESNSLRSLFGSAAAFVAGRINYTFDSFGPSVTLDTACSGSLAAIDMAVNAIFDGKCSRAIVAGVNLILNEKGQGFRVNGKMLSSHGMCKTFDAEAGGYGRSDGCVVMLLEKPKPNHSYLSTLHGVDVNHGGRNGVSITTPSGIAQKMLLKSILATNEKELQYWEAHGTGTPVGDPIEMNTISSIFDHMTVGSVKSLIGHGEAAAGATGIMKLALILSNDYVPPIIHFHTLNKKIQIGSIDLPVVGCDEIVNAAGISSFGASGTNAAVLAEKDAAKENPLSNQHRYYIVPISAKNVKSLEKLEESILETLNTSKYEIGSICSMLASRQHFDYRSALVVNRSCQVIKKYNGKIPKVRGSQKKRLVIDESPNFDILSIPEANKLYEELSKMQLSPQDHLRATILGVLKKISPEIEIKITTFKDHLLSKLIYADSALRKKICQALDIISSKNYKTLHRDLGFSSLIIEGMERELTEGKENCSQIVDYQSFLETVAEMYVAGQQINWSSFYTSPRQYVPVPNYPFNRQSLWFTHKEELFEHYLLGAETEKTDSKTVFSNYLNKLRHPKLFKGPIGTGTVVEIASVALRHAFGSPFIIKDLIMNPISLDTEVWLTTTVLKTATGTSVSVSLGNGQLFTCKAEQTQVFQGHEKNSSNDRSSPTGTLKLPNVPSAVVKLAPDNMNLEVDTGNEKSAYKVLIETLTTICGKMPTIETILVNRGLSNDDTFLISIKNEKSMIVDVFEFDYLCIRLHLQTQAILKDVPLLATPRTQLKVTNQKGDSESEEIVQKVRQAFDDTNQSGEQLGYRDLETNFLELGMDSLTAVDFADRLSKSFPDVKVSVEDVLHYSSIATMCRHLVNLLQVNMKIDVQQKKTKIHDKRENVFLEKNTLDSIREKIVDALNDVLTDGSLEDFSSDIEFMELGLDSLSITDFVARLNKTYFPGIGLEGSELWKHGSLDRLAEHVNQKLAEEESSQKTQNTKSVIQEVFAEGDNLTIGEKTSNSKEFNEDVKTKIMNALRDSTADEVQNEDFEKDLMLIGLDSLSVVDFVNRLNQKYFIGLNIQTSEVIECSSLRDLCVKLETRIGSSKTNITQNDSRRDEIRESVIEAVVYSCPEEIDEAMLSKNFNFMEVGLNSLAVIDFISRLVTKHFPSLELLTTDIFNNPTVDALTAQIENLLGDLTTAEETGSNANNEKSLRTAPQVVQHIGSPANVKQSEVPKPPLIEKDTKTQRESTLENIRNILSQLLTEELTVEENTSVVSLAELGLDSISIGEFVISLNQLYPLSNITNSEILGFESIKELIDHINIVTPPATTVPSAVTTTMTSTEERTNLLENVYVVHREHSTLDCEYLIVSKQNQIQFQSKGNKTHFVLKPAVNSAITQNVRDLPNSEINVFVDVADGIDPTDLFMTLLNFCLELSANKKTVTFTVSDSRTVSNSLARSLLVCMAAEKYPHIKYEWNERIQKLKVDLDDLNAQIGGSWIITGGLSGIGFAIAKWLVEEHKVDKLVLIGRRQPVPEVAEQIEELSKWAHIEILNGDISDVNAMRQLFKTLGKNLDGVIHCAGVLRDARAERQMSSQFKAVFKPKAEGVDVLDRLLDEFDLKPSNFIVMSSVVHILGNVGQTNYSTANAYISHKMRERRLLGKSGTAIHWGNWLETGMASKPVVHEFLVKVGLMGLTTRDALNFVKYAILKRPEEFIAVNVDWEKLIASRPDIRKDILMDGYWEGDQEQINGRKEIEQTEKSSSNHGDEAKVLETISEVVHEQNSQPLESTEAKFQIPIHYNSVEEMNETVHSLVYVLYSMSHRRNSKHSVTITGSNVFEMIRNLNENINERCVPSPRSSLLTKEEYELIDQHRLRGEAVVPGAFSLETMAREANRGCHPGERMILQNIRLSSLWRLSPESCEYKVSNNDERISIKVNDKEVCSSQSAKCELPYNSSMNIVEFEEDCTIDIDCADIYKKLKKNGLNYGELFQVGNAMRVNKDWTKCITTGLVKVPNLYPIIDASFHSIAPIVFHKHPNVHFIPMSMSEVFVDTDAIIKVGQSIEILTTLHSIKRKVLNVSSSIFIDGKLVFEVRQALMMIAEGDPASYVDHPLEDYPFIESPKSYNVCDLSFREIQPVVHEKVEDIANSVEFHIRSYLRIQSNKAVTYSDSLESIALSKKDREYLMKHIEIKFGITVPQSAISPNSTSDTIAKVFVKLLKPHLYQTDISIIKTLRENANPKFNLYLTHPITGSIFPYYVFLKVFPKEVNIYAIEYKDGTDVESFKDLAALYAKAIAAHTKNVQPFLLGHSMGGSLSREMISDLEMWGYKIPFVVMYEAWVSEHQKLNLEAVRNFVTKIESPNRDQLVARTMKLAELIHNHKFTRSSTKAYLFKSAAMSSPLFHECVSVESEANGFEKMSTLPVSVCMINGNHESCIQAANVLPRKNELLDLFKEYLN